MARERVTNVSKENIVAITSAITGVNSSDVRVSQYLTLLYNGLDQNNNSPKAIKERLDSGEITESTYVVTKARETGFVVDTAARIIELYSEIN